MQPYCGFSVARAIRRLLGSNPDTVAAIKYILPAIIVLLFLCGFFKNVSDLKN